MSHVVTIQTKVNDVQGISNACQRLNWPTPVEGSVQFLEEEASGLLVSLPQWVHPVVVEIKTGTLRFDNYQGLWGDQKHLDSFLQAYAVEKCRLEARKKGLGVREQLLQDGSIQLQILEGI